MSEQLRINLSEVFGAAGSIKFWADAIPAPSYFPSVPCGPRGDGAQATASDVFFRINEYLNHYAAELNVLSKAMEMGAMEVGKSSSTDVTFTTTYPDLPHWAK